MTRIASMGLILMLLVAVCQAGCGPAAAPGPAPPVEEPTSAPAPTAPGEEPTVAPTPVPPTATPPPPAEEAPAPTSTPVPPLLLSSGAFDAGGEMPVQYSCHGANLSPPLGWSGVPEGTQSLALIVDDPDSDPPGFVHWVIYNIPAAATGLPEGVPPEPSLPDGAQQGKNDFALFVDEGQTFPGGAPVNRVGYDGPCPGDTHHYVFKLYALDATLDVLAESTMADLLLAMEGHVLGEAELTGVYTPQP
jgi:Raf kinase inhibitor-like YbhB/YbcL family protein